MKRSNRTYWSSIILFALLVIALAGPGRVGAQDLTGVQEGQRSFPPVRISIGATYQEWSNDTYDIQQLSIPLSAQMRLVPNLDLGIGLSQATASGENFEEISGLTDVVVDVRYRLRLSRFLIGIHLGANLPSGTSQFTQEEYLTLAQIGRNQFNFTVPHFGQGTILAPGVTIAVPVVTNFIVSAGVSLRFRESFEPIVDLPDPYSWGNETLLTAGVLWQASPTVSFTTDAIFVFYNGDSIGDVIVYASGQRVVLRSVLHVQLQSSAHLWLQFNLRSKEDNDVFTGIAFQPELINADPSFTQGKAQYQVRFTPSFRITAHASYTKFGSDAAFSEVENIGFGLAPEFTLAPGLSLSISGTYTTGDFTGTQLGSMLIAAF